MAQLSQRIQDLPYKKASHGYQKVLKQQLLQKFKSLSAISQANLVELEQILPKDAAAAVYHHFHQEQEDRQ